MISAKKRGKVFIINDYLQIGSLFALLLPSSGLVACEHGSMIV